jgi:hypothetical protein
MNLSKDLRENNIMVLRLGVSSSKNTQFALIRPTTSILDDYFLRDEIIFEDKQGAKFTPIVSYKQVYTFKIPPKLSETSLVNLGLASGIISSALSLDKNESPLAPATGNSTFTFS